MSVPSRDSYGRMRHRLCNCRIDRNKSSWVAQIQHRVTGMQCTEHTENCFVERSRVEIMADGIFRLIGEVTSLKIVLL